MNLSVNKSTGRAPYEALMGYLPRFEADAVRASMSERYEEPERVRQDIVKSILKAQEMYKTEFDKHKHNKVTYDLGDIVYVQTYIEATGESTKLRNKYDGPFVVVKVLPSDTYQIDKLSKKRKSAIPFTSHVSQMRIWRNTDDPCNFDDSETADDCED